MQKLMNTFIKLLLLYEMMLWHISSRNSSLSNLCLKTNKEYFFHQIPLQRSSIIYFMEMNLKGL